MNFKSWTLKDANTRCISVRCGWNCSLPSVSYCWWSFSSTSSHLLSLQSVTLLACSLNASPCVPAAVPYYCTFQGTMSTCMLTCISRVWLFAIPWTVAHQAPLSVGFSRQECWSAFPCLTPGDLPNPGIEPRSLTSFALAGRVLYH